MTGRVAGPLTFNSLSLSSTAAVHEAVRVKFYFRSVLTYCQSRSYRRREEEAAMGEGDAGKAEETLLRWSPAAAVTRPREATATNRTANGLKTRRLGV